MNSVDAEQREGAVGETRGELILYWSEAEGAVLAEAPELPGCTARGATYEDALANLLAAVEAWRDEALEAAAAD